jgi:predicted DNA-binding protein (MmcQ/YjbR family)
MNIEEFQTYCLQKKGSHEDFPFGDDTLVMKVLGKIFALANLDGPMRINLKCDPEKAVDLREQFPSVRQGYHMDKKHWNTIDMDGSVPDFLIREWIDHSYELVVAKLPLKLKKEL